MDSRIDVSAGAVAEQALTQFHLRVRVTCRSCRLCRNLFRPGVQRRKSHEVPGPTPAREMPMSVVRFAQMRND